MKLWQRFISNASSQKVLCRTWKFQIPPSLSSGELFILYLIGTGFFLFLWEVYCFDLLGMEKERRKQSSCSRKRLLFESLTFVPHVLSSLGTFLVNYALRCCHSFSFGIHSFGKHTDCDCRAWSSEKGRATALRDWGPGGGLRPTVSG